MYIMAKHLILMAGNIGSGKTSLTERIGKQLGWITAYESVVNNPYLPNFYADMRAWAFHLQIYFLGHRAQQHINMAESPQSAIIDRSIYEDAHIFARALNHMGNLSDLDFQAYLKVYELVIRNLPKPDLLIYLKAPVSVLMDRIKLRGREIENTINQDYLKLLDDFYDDWIAGYEECPVLTLRSDDLDFVNLREHLDIVVAKINEKLKGKETLRI